MKKIVLIILIFMMIPIVNGKNYSILRCVGENSGVKVETKYIIDINNTNKYFFIINVDNVTSGFTKNLFSVVNREYVGGGVKTEALDVMFYIPTNEINTGSEPFKGRILFFKKKNGVVSKLDSRGFDAYCSFN